MGGSRLSAIVWAVVWLCLALGGCVSLSACGTAAHGDAKPGVRHGASTNIVPPLRQKVVVEPAARHKVLVRVGRHTITLAYVEEWTPLEILFASPYKQSSSVPAGYVPDPPSYRNCAAYLAANSSPSTAAGKSSESQLVGQCEHQWEYWVRFTLSHLIKYAWLDEEGRKMGVKIEPSDLHSVIAESRVKPSVLEALGVPPSYQDTVAGAEAISRKVFTILPVYRRKERETKEGIHETEQTAFAIDRQFYAWYDGIQKRWAPKTQCDPEWIVWGCSEYAPDGQNGPL